MNDRSHQQSPAGDMLSLKLCEDSLNALFICLNKEGPRGGDFNVCRGAYSAFKTCSDSHPSTITVEKAKDDGGSKREEADRSLSGALQAALPRVFKNVEDLPRERTILSDTLAKVAPHIFDPQDGDDDDADDKNKDKDK